MGMFLLGGTLYSVILSLALPDIYMWYIYIYASVPSLGVLLSFPLEGLK